ADGFEGPAPEVFCQVFGTAIECCHQEAGAVDRGELVGDVFGDIVEVGFADLIDGVRDDLHWILLAGGDVWPPCAEQLARARLPSRLGEADPEGAWPLRATGLATIGKQRRPTTVRMRKRWSKRA